MLYIRVFLLYHIYINGQFNRKTNQTNRKI